MTTDIHCPRCEEPLPRDALDCARCGLPLVARGPYRAAARTPPPDAPVRTRVAGVPYVVLGRIARGEACDVLLARRDARLTERVVIKRAREPRSAERLAAEWRALGELHARHEVQGAWHFGTLLPQPVAHEARASVFRWRSGFVHTLDDVVCEYPDGVEPQTAVWMWKRLLGLLGWVHRAGFVHGAVVPRHVMVHARDHGATLVGWSRAVRLAGGATRALGAVPAELRVYYPPDVLRGAAPSPATDIAMSARCMVHVLGGDVASGAPGAHVPEALAAVVRLHARDPGDEVAEDAERAGGPRSEDAWELMERVGRAGREAFGPPRYHPFHMPGWG